MRCTACDAELPAQGHECPACGAKRSDSADALAPTQAGAVSPSAPTVAVPSGPPPDPESGSGLIAGRYRLIERLGKGGMGEVFRAFDGRLQQEVALKFLPPELAGDAAYLERFRNEVRTAREVTHRAVCRVYDLGEADGKPYISMEYIDGEDLATLMRRIGRLPDEKAVEIAHQLCAGLHAAHERGILHRDLKPANVMLDGDGRVKITDFGLAATGPLPEHELRDGTPAYQAPEQLEGRDVSVRSDVYSLGLVLFELFTGRRAFEARRDPSTKVESPTTVRAGVDPVVERAILRCLEPDPDLRPPSALAVAAALPGGDPVAAALAAGELPSPEVVAASGEVGALRPWVGFVLLLGFVLMVVTGAALFEEVQLIGVMPPIKPVPVLVDGAKSVVGAVGIEHAEADRAHALARDVDLFNELYDRGDEWQAYRDPPGSPIWLSYRERPLPHTLVPENDVMVRRDNPPLGVVGEVRVEVDGQGRLRTFRRVPDDIEEPEGSLPPPFDWSALFELAGLDAAFAVAVPPRRIPGAYADARVAWLVHDAKSSTDFRVEAAALRGVPVHFEVAGPWEALWPGVEPNAGRTTRLGAFGMATALVLLVVVTLTAGAAVLLVIRSLRRGAADRRVANRIALLGVVTPLCAGALAVHTGGGLGPALNIILSTVPRALTIGLFVWVFYVAAEPQARRFWPSAMVSWSRLVAGRWRDPLVGRDLLIGVACGAALYLTRQITALPNFGDSPQVLDLDGLLSARHALGETLSSVIEGIAQAALYMMFFVAARLVFRRTWVVVVFAVVAAVGIGAVAQVPDLPGAIRGLVGVTLFLGCIFRTGLLGLCAMFVADNVLAEFPVTVDFAAEYAGSGLWAAALVLALAVYGFRNAVGHGKLFSDAFFER